MERIEDLLSAGVSAEYTVNGRKVWLPALPLPFYNLKRQFLSAGYPVRQPEEYRTGAPPAQENKK